MKPSIEHWVLQLTGGLGEVCMLLAACKALKTSDPACRIWVLIVPAFAELAAACPHVDEVFTDPSRLDEAMLEARFHHPDFRPHTLDAVLHSLVPIHKIDSYLTLLDSRGLPPDSKTLELTGISDLPEVVAAIPPPPAGKRRIVFHPVRGNPNRTWPKASWEAIGRRVLEEGHQLILVGDRRPDPATSIFSLELAGALDLTNRLAWPALLALLRHADILLCADDDLVQLAGASDVAICAIHTTMPGQTRLPFRHGQPFWGATSIEPSCPQKGCHLRLAKPENLPSPQARILQEGGAALDAMMADWCLETDVHHCLSDISPDRVWEAMVPWVEVGPLQRKERCGAAEALGAEGRVAEALEILDSIPPVDLDFQTGLVRARLLLEAGEAGAASQILDGILGTWPMHGETLNLLCLACIRNGMADTARALAERASRHGGPAQAVSRNRAYLEALGSLESNDPATAHEALKRAGMIHARDSISDLELAVLSLSALLLQHRIKEAEALLAWLGPSVPSHADLSYLAGEVHLRLNQNDSALLAFKRCVELDPRHEMAAARILEIQPR